MIAQDQAQAVGFLKDPSTYGLAEPIEVIETHISIIFLAGERAYKLKRAVHLPYADFSTPELRLAACDKEVDLNRRTAPSLYLGVRRITREPDGRLAFDGAGEPVDGVVEMARFDQDRLFDSMAGNDNLTPDLMTEAARVIARFHDVAPVVRAGSGADNISRVLDINTAGFATSHLFGDEEISDLNARFEVALGQHRPQLDARERDGLVRRCHGDLHLRNICLLDGQPRLFDCIEFSEEIATVDVLYDLAFLLMDLWHRDLAGHANLVMNRYLDQDGTDAGAFLLSFFMAVRAAVRAHVTATQIEEGGERTEHLERRAQSYFDLARDLLEPSLPALTAIGGLSGSGKSTVADGLAPFVGSPPGARIIESDRTRKAMFSVPPETRLGPEAYEPGVSDKVYAQMAQRAEALLAEGGTVIVDAVFDLPEHRQRMADVARRQSVPLTGIWLETDPATLRQRVMERHKGVSDATVEVLDRQLEKDVGRMEWHRLDAGTAPARLVEHILGLAGRSAPTTGRLTASGRNAGRHRAPGHDGEQMVPFRLSRP